MRRILLATALFGAGCHRSVAGPLPAAPGGPSGGAPRVLVQRAALPDKGFGSERPWVVVGGRALVLTQGAVASLWRRPEHPGETPIKVAEHVATEIINGSAVNADGTSAAITTGAGAVRFDADGRERRFELDLAGDNSWPLFVGERLLVLTSTTLYDPAAGSQATLPDAAVGAPPATTTVLALTDDIPAWNAWNATGRPPDGVGVVRRAVQTTEACGELVAVGYDDGTVDLWRGMKRTRSLTSAKHAGLTRFLAALAWSDDCATLHAVVRLPAPALVTWNVAGDTIEPSEFPLPAEIAPPLASPLPPRRVGLTVDGRLRIDRAVWARAADGKWRPVETREGGGVTALGPGGAVAHVEGNGELEINGAHVPGSVRWQHLAVDGANAAFATDTGVHLLRPDSGSRVDVPGLRAMAMAGGKLYVADATPALRVYDAQTGAAQGVTPLQHRVGAIAVSPTRGIVALAGSSTGFWLQEAGETEALDLGIHPVTALRWSPDGTRLAVGNSAGDVWTIDTVSQQVVKVGELGHLVLDLFWQDGLIATLSQRPARRLPSGATDGVWNELDWQAVGADASPVHGLARAGTNDAVQVGARSFPREVRARGVRWTQDGRLCWYGDTAGCVTATGNQPGLGVRLVGDAADTRVDERGRVVGDTTAVRVEPPVSKAKSSDE